MYEFAQGLRELRAAAGSPPYRELARRARYSHSALSDAAAGRRLPTLGVTLALVAACGGDVDAWRARWTELDARLRATHPELLAVQPDSGSDGVTADADAASGSVMHREDDKPVEPAGGSDRPQGPSPDTPQASDARPASAPAAAWQGALAAAAGPAPSGTPVAAVSRTPTVVDSPAVAPLRKGDPARVGGFRLLGRLGSGAMGEVFLGQSVAGRPVAIKVIRAGFAQDTAFRRRFAAEVATARRVQGPYTPAVVGADAEAERPWLATTYIAGPSLADVVRTGGPLPAPVVRALAAGIAKWRAGRLTLAKMAEPLDISWSRPLPEGTEPTTATVSRDAAGRWFVSLLCEDAVTPAAPTANAVGLDAGITCLVTLSTGEKITNPKHERRDRARLARAQRELSRKTKGSANREKARRKVARVHARIATDAATSCTCCRLGSSVRTKRS